MPSYYVNFDPREFVSWSKDDLMNQVLETAPVVPEFQPEEIRIFTNI